MSSSGNREGGAAAGSAAQIDLGAHGDALQLSLAPGGAFIDRLTRLLALMGGVLLVAAIILTLFSVAGRYLLGLPVPGDYELVEISCGVAVFFFFPFTHALGSNLKAEFFTSGLPIKYQRTLDVLHDIIFALLGGLMTWRMVHGFEDKFASGETSILIGVPLWWGYGVGVFSLALLTLVCVLRVIAGARSVRS